jgi:hypothetical protein
LIFAEIVCLWLSMTIQYRIELGSISFALMEPFALLLAASLLSYQLIKYKTIFLTKDLTIYILIAFIVWLTVISWVNNDMNRGLSDLRDWIIPVSIYIFLITSRRKRWKELTLVFMLLATANSIFGIYQHIINSFRPFITDIAATKTSFTITEEDRLATGSFAVGFFSHPNSFAIYLYFALMICIGWVIDLRNRRGISWMNGILWRIAICLILAITLYLTYAKASLLVIASTLPIFLMALILHKPSLLTIIILGVLYLSAIAIGIWFGVNALPSPLLVSIWWRISLWRSAIETLSAHPLIFLLGNGLNLFAARSIYPQPHQVYIFSILQYGLLGFFLIIWLGFVSIHRGILAFHQGIFRQ